MPDETKAEFKAKVSVMSGLVLVLGVGIGLWVAFFMYT
jgi:hypothetical protein